MKKPAFTLIELIVVVTILSILGVIGFIAYSSYLLGVRDTSRTTQLLNIKNGLEVFKIENKLPFPDDNIEVKDDIETLGYQGYAGIGVLSTIIFSKGGKDPLDGSYFTYYLSDNKKYFQLMAFLEKENTEISLGNHIITQTYAIDYENRYPTLVGEKLGILLQETTNIPIQEVSSIITQGELDFNTDSNNYVAYFEDNDSYTSSGSDLTDKIAVKSIIGNYKNCKDLLYGNSILSGIDGIYKISLNGNSFNVYCDMTSDGGGWTLILTKANSTNHSQFVSGRGTDLDDATTNTDNLISKNDFASLNPSVLRVEIDDYNKKGYVHTSGNLYNWYSNYIITVSSNLAQNVSCTYGGSITTKNTTLSHMFNLENICGNNQFWFMTRAEYGIGAGNGADDTGKKGRVWAK